MFFNFKCRIKVYIYREWVIVSIYHYAIDLLTEKYNHVLDKCLLLYKLKIVTLKSGLHII